MQANTASEHAHQVTLVSWFDRNYPEYAGRLFAIPNGGLRSKAVAVKLSLEGVRKGVPDLFLPVPNIEYIGFFIELKKHSGKVSREQKDWVEYLSSVGYKALIIYGWEDAAKEISHYMNGVGKCLQTMNNG